MRTASADEGNRRRLTAECGTWSWTGSSPGGESALKNITGTVDKVGIRTVWIRL